MSATDLAGLAQTPELSIAIAGADSTALTTALACRAAGFSDVTLFEGDESSQAELPPHASVELSPNASRILRTLKTLEDLREQCFEPQFVHQRSYRTGFQLSILALGAMAEGRYNAPFLNIEAEALTAVLNRIACVRGIKRVTGAPEQFRQQHNCVTFAINNKHHKHDVLIVAADPEDRWRKLAAAENLTRAPTQALYWQANVLTDALPEGAFGPVITQWLGPQHYLSYHFGAGAQRLHLSAITQSAVTQSASSNPQPLMTALADWHPSVRALVEAADSLHCQPVIDTVSPERLAHGQIVFLASSCHSLLPHLPQQTALGIEDAWVVARMLEQWEEEPASGWIEYEKYRLPRARRMQTQAQLRAEKLCEPGAAKAWQRNLGLSLSSRFLPELAMQKNDWLYGYDAVNGFE